MAFSMSGGNIQNDADRRRAALIYAWRGCDPSRIVPNTMRRLIRLAPWLAPSLALVLAAANSVAQDGGTSQGSPFSESERAELDAGRLVAHRRMERRGSYVYFGGTSYQTVARPIEEVWRAAREPSRY